MSREDGAEVAFRALESWAVEMPAPPPTCSIPPGSSIGHWVDLAEWFPFAGPGDYAVRLGGRGFESDWLKFTIAG